MLLVLDANILMRAVLGKGTRRLLEKYGASVDLVAPDPAFEEAATRTVSPVFRLAFRNGSCRRLSGYSPGWKAWRVGSWKSAMKTTGRSSRPHSR
jgi:hypothetical protein